jgi:hypothetical protein
MVWTFSIFLYVFLYVEILNISLYISILVISLYISIYVPVRTKKRHHPH